MAILTLLTDFGLDDHYVAAVKGVVLGLAPDTTLVDISHGVAPGDVEAAAHLLAAAAPAFPTGTVHLVVVDPGVGSGRRLLVAEAAGWRFVAPDNGVLHRVLEKATVWSAERPDLWRRAPGATFEGRDRLAPIAAFLLRGGAPGDLGPRVADAVRLELPAPRRLAEWLEGRVRRVDRFGNLVTDLPWSWLEGEDEVEAEVGGHLAAHRATHYAALPADEPGLLAGSSGTLELALRGASLAERWRIGRGEPVVVRLRRPR